MRAEVFIDQSEGGVAEISVVKLGLSSGAARKFHTVEEAKAVLLVFGFDRRLSGRFSPAGPGFGHRTDHPCDGSRRSRAPSAHGPRSLRDPSHSTADLPIASASLFPARSGCMASRRRLPAWPSALSPASVPEAAATKPRLARIVGAHPDCFVGRGAQFPERLKLRKPVTPGAHFISEARQPARSLLR